ncbi:MAG: T9SS type A sorting domain-containing protein [Flavobacteriia bacterium]|jgi:hypothetical protein
MKKIYFTVFSLAFGLSLTAQVSKVNKSLAPKGAFDKKMTIGDKIEHQTIVREKTTFYTNDFSNPGDWAIGNNATGAGASDNWVIGTAGPAGGFAIDAIVSTSAANGFALFDSDLLCSGDQSAWIGNSVPVNCSGQSTVAIEFESFYRKFNDSVYVQVSTDNTNWTNFNAYPSYGNNDISPSNPELVAINISSVAANQATVYFRFLFWSDAVNGGDGCGYAWMVDDVSLRNVDNNDLVLNKLFWGTLGSWGARLPYTKVPADQIQPVSFGGIVTNAGALAQNDIVFTATATGYNGTSSATALASAASDTLECLTQLTVPSALGTTSVAFNVISSATDASPADNSLPAQGIEVTNGVYARDLGVIEGGSYNQGNAFEVGNIFDIFSTTQALSVTFVPTATAVAGAQVYVRVYGGGLNFYEESNSYTLLDTDLGNPVTLQLNSAVDLIADSSYCIVVGSFGDGGNSNDLVVATSGESEAQTSFYLDGTDGTWYYTTATPIVRLNITPTSVGLAENANVASFGVYPNPAKENVTISFDLKNETAAKVQITDLAGKEVYASNLGNKAGKNSVSVNTNTFANGIYVVNFITNNGVVTEKLVINK